MELDILVQLPRPLSGNKRCPLFGVINVIYNSDFRRDIRHRPLYGKSPLFRVCVKRDFTVVVTTVHKN